MRIGFCSTEPKQALAIYLLYLVRPDLLFLVEQPGGSWAFKQRFMLSLSMTINLLLVSHSLFSFRSLLHSFVCSPNTCICLVLGMSWFILIYEYLYFSIFFLFFSWCPEVLRFHIYGLFQARPVQTYPPEDQPQAHHFIRSLWDIWWVAFLWWFSQQLTA